MKSKSPNHGVLRRMDPVATSLRSAAQLAFAMDRTDWGLNLLEEAVQHYVRSRNAYGFFLAAVFARPGILQEFPSFLQSREAQPFQTNQNFYGYLANLALLVRTQDIRVMDINNQRELLERNCFGRIGPHDVPLQVYLNATDQLHKVFTSPGSGRLDHMFAFVHLIEAYSASLVTAKKDEFHWHRMSPRIDLVDLDLVGLLYLYKKTGIDVFPHFVPFAPISQAFDPTTSPIWVCWKFLEQLVSEIDSLILQRR